MVWIIVIVCVLGICIYIGLSTGKELEEQSRNKFSKQGYHFVDYCGAEYKGGIKDISINNSVSIDILEEGLNFSSTVGDKLILFEKVKDISLQNKQYIENQVSLGKLLVFGVLAFGMNKNKKQINDEYIVIKVSDEDGEYNILLQAHEYTNNQDVYNKIAMNKKKR
jgi:hypothetical protein